MTLGLLGYPSGPSSPPCTGSSGSVCPHYSYSEFACSQNVSTTLPISARRHGHPQACAVDSVVRVQRCRSPGWAGVVSGTRSVLRTPVQAPFFFVFLCFFLVTSLFQWPPHPNPVQHPQAQEEGSVGMILRSCCPGGCEVMSQSH